MASPKPRPGRLLVAALIVAVPGLIALVVFAAVGEVRPALIALGLAALAIAAVAELVALDADRLVAWLGRLADEGEPAAPRLRTAPARLARLALQRLAQAWRRRERALQAERDGAVAVVAALPDPLLIIDAQRNVIRVNDAALALFGASLLGHDLAESLRHPDVLTAVDRVLAQGGSETIEFTQPVPIERVFAARIIRFAREPTQGPATLGPAALVALHDLTSIKRAEQARADFAANASHELRTPLSTLIGFIDTLRGPARDDAEAHDRFLKIMGEQADRMSRLVNDLLSLSRIELDEHKPPTEEVALAPLLARVLDGMELRASQRRMTLALELEPGLPAVAGDEEQLVQVFQNLVDNAIKYARADTPVTVRSWPARDGEVAIAVVDRGDGIAREHINRLTERFYRVDPGRSKAIGGTGLGLAIVKHIVSRHRGRLEIQSEQGRGSTFVVVLPALRR